MKTKIVERQIGEQIEVSYADAVVRVVGLQRDRVYLEVSVARETDWIQPVLSPGPLLANK